MSGLPPELRDPLEAALGTRITQTKPVAGGDINHAQRLELADGRRVFLKTPGHGSAVSNMPGLYVAEAAGLNALSDAAERDGALSIPEVLAVNNAFLVLEAIDTAPPPADFEEQLGHGLALLHRAGTTERFGFPCDTYLGRLPQANPTTADWIRFWRDQRLLPLLDALPKEKEVNRLGRQLADRLPDLLAGPDEPPTLIHGDLWTGNACADAAGRVWIYDPACSFAHREAEFGMTRLFGFGPRFEAAYHEANPLADGWQRRVEVYRLHHLLSHLWHFGGSYRDGCLRLLGQLLA